MPSSNSNRDAYAVGESRITVDADKSRWLGVVRDAELLLLLFVLPAP